MTEPVRTFCQGKQTCPGKPLKVYWIPSEGGTIPITFCETCWDRERRSIVNAPDWKGLTKIEDALIGRPRKDRIGTYDT